MTTYRVTVAGGYVVARSPNLAFAVAQARALTLRGYTTWLRDDAGNCVEIARTADRFSLASPVDPPWLGTCRALLTEHGLNPTKET